MPQQTNLNVAPYFDDFDPANDYHKVLFKPGYPVQARELTNLQSILQNQIEKFGQHFFKEGAKVIPGNTGYTQLYYCIQLQNTFQGIPVAAYVDQLIGTKITGETSGVTAVVDKVLLPEDSERNNLTLYINYLQSNTANNQTQTFSDSENLTTNITISSGLLGNTTIASGSPFAITIANDAAATGSAFQIQEGVYFIHGNFVTVESETLLLDQYTNTPSYRVGLNVQEQIITADLDEELNDNSQGYNNFSAPGADRLKITTTLFKKPIDNFDDDNFIELATVNAGLLKSASKSGFGVGPNGGVFYEDLTNVLARRTYAESGDYYTSPFDINVSNSLNDNVGNRGLYQEGQFTPGGETASDDLAIYKISPGKAFVRGYEIETKNPTFLDVPKPRTANTVENQQIIYNTGPTLKLNNVYGAPTIGIGNTYTVSLRDRRVGVNSRTVAGNEIGVARIYDMALESGSYDSANPPLNEWDISLYDIQTVTHITLNQPITLSTPVYIKGANSGATAFLKDSVTAGLGLTVYETNGTFIKNEGLIFNGDGNGRIALAITATSLKDVKSIFGTNDKTVGTASTFAADVMQSVGYHVGLATIGAALQSGIATITAFDPKFVGIATIGNLLCWNDATAGQYPTYARVTAVNSNTVEVVGVTTVSGFINGGLSTSTASTQVEDLKILQTDLQESSDNTLYTPLPKISISDVDLTDASISIRKTYTVNISSNKLASAVSCGSSEVFLAFDEERYTLIRSDGQTEALSQGDLIFTDGTSLQIYNLGANDTGATLVTTVRKLKPRAKEKLKNRVNSVIVSKSRLEGSGIGTTSFNDGLDYGGGGYPYGTRVQDELLSLNTPDIIEIHGVYESADTGAASAPKVTLSSLTTPSTTTAELIVGEKIKGLLTGAVAIVAEKITNSSTQIAFIYKNDIKFKEGEQVSFLESKAEAEITTLDAPSFDISSNYTFTIGQESTFYDFGAIKRKSDADAPTKQIKIYFMSAYYASTDTGDVTTVNSYKDFDYASEIKEVNDVSNHDMIDIRPRVSDYTVSESSRSPLEFYGRSFNGAGQSAGNVLASDEAITITYSNYLGRIDRIFLTKDGKFQVKYGSPSDRPEKPSPVDDALEIATLTLPPYLYYPQQVRMKYLDHKRYRMVDIKKLDDRIKNLEYYTALSTLETTTANMFVSDADGLNRFKSGFFVDNFSGFRPQEDELEIKNSLDTKYKQLRPKHYTNSIDLMFGPVTNVDSTEDQAFSTVEGINVRKQSDAITLDYSEIEYIKQSFGTRSESVTPFLISFWQGTLELTPASDTWVDTVRLEAKVIEIEGDYERTMEEAARTMNVDPQTGFAPTVWNSWETNWTGSDIVETTRTRTTTSGGEWQGWMGQPGGGVRPAFGTRTTTTVEEKVRSGRRTGVRSRTGTRTVISEAWDRTSVGDRVVSRDLVPYCRSRNVEFVSKRVKPLTRMYSFFDGEDVTKFCVPKLLEISMNSGSFQVGETVKGYLRPTGLNAVGPWTQGSDPTIVFRVAQSNHKEGPYNIPTKVYPESPYSSSILPASYSSNSTVLNIDTYSLSQEVQGDFYGWVETGMILKGVTSSAEATITDVRLISDLAADLTGSFYIPNPNNIDYPRFEVGTKVFTLVNDKDNNQDDATTICEEAYTAAGTLETVQENIVAVRNARIEQKQAFQERNVSEVLDGQVVSSRVTNQTSERVQIGWYDPLAQSFLVEDDTGVYLTKCDVFFRSKDDMDIPCVFQIRTMENGFPTQHILPFSEIVLAPEEIETSSDGSVATSINFKSPVYCEGGKEYAVALASNSTKYSVYISRIGEQDLLTQTYISNQPYLGSLFKSQNASTWEASQWEDLKFTLYRADFVESGSVELYNPILSVGNDQVSQLMPDSLVLQSKEIRVGLGTTVADGGLKPGNVVYQMGTQATGNLAGVAGSVSSLAVTNAGLGYSPSDGQITYSGVNLVTITGNGRGGTANITINSGSIVSSGATINAGGSGYQVGDVVGFNTLGLTTQGRNARLSVVSVGGTSELIINNVQGDFVVAGSAKTMMYIDTSNTVKTLNSVNGGDVQVSSIIDVTGKDGLHAKVNHKNHGMYWNNNSVEISGVESDVKPTKLAVAYELGSTGTISVDDAANFSTFENVGVGTTNTGFLRIANEIIEYTSVSGNIIGGNIVRECSKLNSGPSLTYPVGTPVYKYELGGVNLGRVNKTHALSDVTIVDPISYDSYYVKLDMSTKFDNNGSNDDRSNDTGFPKLFLNNNKSAGGYQIRASQNMPFEVIRPVIHNVSVEGTTITGELRTTTATSFSGTEIPWIDNGFEPITINQTNYLTTPRTIASQINATNLLTNFTGEKSLQLRLFLNTSDSRVSPVIDAQRCSVITTSNRVNNVIKDFATDNRVNSVIDDPTACQYISKEIILENNASSIKIMVDAHIHLDSDIRAFYAISDQEGFEPVFTPFPGYKNIDVRGEVINSENNNGQSDRLVPKSNSYGFVADGLEFKEYVFSMDRLPAFRVFRVKLITTSNSQVYVPRMRDLRVIALA